MSSSVNSCTIDSPSPELPTDSDSLQIKEEVVTVNVSGKDINVHTVQSFNKLSDLSKALTVIFLHGGKFSSKNWLDIKTLQHIANWGHAAVAIDLPGKGQTSETIEKSEAPNFLAGLIDKLESKRIVIVSPSSSGNYAQPYLFTEPKTSMDRAVGYVPVAPGSVSDFRDKYSDCQLPTLIVYGTEDPVGSRPVTISNCSQTAKSAL